MSFWGKHKKNIWYAIYFIFITAVFLFYCFPSESVQAYIQSLANDRLTGSDFSLEDVSPSLPFGWKIRGAELSPKKGQGLKLRAEEITIQPDPWSFIKGERIYNFESQIYGGSVKGSVYFIDKKTGPPYSLSMILSDINFKNRQIIQGASRELEGRLGGTIQYEAKSDNIYGGSGEAELILSGGNAEIALPLLALDVLRFDQLMLKSQLKNRILNVVQLQLNGPEINGTLSGSIVPNRLFFLKSRINLRGEIEPLPEFFQKLSDNPSTQEIIQKNLKNGKLAFIVSGTLDEPRMRIL